jgi:hypothetical protein
VPNEASPRPCERNFGQRPLIVIHPKSGSSAAPSANFLFGLQFAFSAVSVDEWLLSNEKVVTTSLSYDNDGNLTSSGTSTFTWDYNNRMTQAVTQGSTSTYAYATASMRSLAPGWPALSSLPPSSRST